MLHYMLDAYGTDEENANNLMCVNELLIKVMQDLSLSPVMPPFLLPYYYCEDAYDGGISAFCFCRGGHVTIHTFPFKGCYFVDVFCDEFFTKQEAEKAFTNRLYARKVQSELVDRRFPDSFPKKEDGDAADFGPHYLINVSDVDLTMEAINVILDSIPSLPSTQRTDLQRLLNGTANVPGPLPRSNTVSSLPIYPSEKSVFTIMSLISEYLASE